jgi:hypothetical protein
VEHNISLTSATLLYCNHALCVQGHPDCQVQVKQLGVRDEHALQPLPSSHVEDGLALRPVARGRRKQQVLLSTAARQGRKWQQNKNKPKPHPEVHTSCSAVPLHPVLLPCAALSSTGFVALSALHGSGPAYTEMSSPAPSQALQTTMNKPTACRTTLSSGPQCKTRQQRTIRAG